jgi:hypothetical protein
MDLKDIASVSGRGGLFKVVKPTRTGVILETIDQTKSRLIANANNRVSLLKEISVYVTTQEASLPLENVFASIFKKHGKKLTVSAKSSDQELQNFLGQVVPDYDTEKVYNSDIKKIVNWYSILMEHFPEVFEKPKEEVKKEGEAEKEKVEKKESKKDEKKEKKEAPKPAAKVKAKTVAKKK